MGDYNSIISEEIFVYKSIDKGKKPVVNISSLHEGVDITVMKKKISIREVVKCGKSIFDYNKYIGGVDHFNKLQESYNIFWKSQR